MLLHSCDSLFTTHQLKNQSILPHFPFIESVFEELLTRLKKESIITFKGIETKHNFLPGYYDYAFTVIYANGDKFIQWQIADETDAYNAIRVEQQSSHEQKAFPREKPSRPNR